MTLSIPPDLEQAIATQARQQQISIDELVRRALDRYLNGTPRPSSEQSISSKPADPGPPSQPDPDTYFAQELATYEHHRAVLEREHMGKFALLRGDELIGVYETWEAAGDEGRRRFGLGKFMIFEIGDQLIEMFIGDPG